MGSSTRRAFLQAAGASAAAAVAFGPAGFTRRPDRPNVLVVVIDSLRADAVGAYGGWARTPNIDALAREGLRFTRVYPEAMPTVPARNSILSGRRVFPFRGWHDQPGLIAAPGWSPLRHVDQSLLPAMRRAGFWTGYVTDNPFLGFARGYAPFRHSANQFRRTGGQIGGNQPLSSVPSHVLKHWLYPATLAPGVRERVAHYLANGHQWNDASRSYAARVFGDAIRMLERAVHHRPFLLVVDTYEPHEPWTPPPSFLRLYDDRAWRGPEPAMPRYMRTSNWLGPGERGRVLARMRDLYAAEVTMTDHYLGLLLDRLHDLGLARETAILLVSDHGILLGEHGWTGKIQNELYPALTRVPLILVDPRRRHAGRTSHWFASTHDIAPTVLGMAGVLAPAAMTGVDLSRVFRGHRLPPRHYAYGGYSDSFFIRSDQWAMWALNRPENFHLYDLRRDPGYSVNLAGTHPSVVGELYAKVRERAGGRLPFYGE